MKQIKEKFSVLVSEYLAVSVLAFSARGHGFDTGCRWETFQCLNMLSLVSFVGMTLNKCAVLRIGMLTGVTSVQVNEPYSSLNDFL